MKAQLGALLILAMTPHAAATLPLTAPEEAGFSSDRLRQVSAFVERDIATGKMAGTVTLIARHGKVVHFEAAGTRGVEDDRPMERDALFRIYSMTKPITTVAAMILYEEGRFQLNEPVAKYLPEFEGQRLFRDGNLVPPESPMTIEQLMTHSAGLASASGGSHPVEEAYREAELFESGNLNEFTDRLARLPLRFEPGRRYHYSVATDVLGALIERISGISLEAFFRQRIFEPLGMHDTFFNVPEAKLGRVVPNHYWDQDQRVMRPIPEANQSALRGVTLFSGGHGLISSAMDYLVFCEMLRRGGSFEGTRILGPKTVQFMTLDHLGEAVRNRGASEFPAYHLYPGQSFGLGFGVITEPGRSGVISSLGAYSWGGVANTKFWVDPEEDLVAILMTQIIGSPWSDQTRFNLKVTTYQALTDLGSD